MTADSRRIGVVLAIVAVLVVAAVLAAGAAVMPGGTTKARADDPIVLSVYHNGVWDNKGVLTGGTLVKSYTQSELAAVSTYDGYAGFKKSTGTVVGPYPVEGAKISDVLTDALGAPGLTAEQSVDVYSPIPAPYIQTITYDQVENASPSNFQMYDATTKQQLITLPAGGALSAVLVWSLGDPLEPLPAEEGPLRFYVADAQSDNAVMLGSMSVFAVTRLNVRDQVLSPWTLKLIGLKKNGTKPTDTIDQNTYQSCSAQGCHGAAFKIAGQAWTGVPLYLLMGEVDGGKDMTYNAKLARKGYRIRLYPASGKAVTIDSNVTVRRSSIIVANGVDGAALSDLYYPLRLVGPPKYVPAGKRLGRITKIVMLPLRP